MHRRALPIVPTPQVDALLLEVVQRNRLVSLCGHVHDVDTEVVANVHVSAVLQKELDQHDVASEGREMKRCEAIVRGLAVQPCLNL